MVVKDLTNFISKSSPNSTKRVSIRKLACQHRKKNSTTNNVTIVVDTKNLFSFLCNNTDNLLGGQFVDLLKIIGDFIRSFKKLEINLVFFYRQLVSDKLEYWLNKNDDSVEDVERIYNRIKAQLPLQETNQYSRGFVIQMALRFLSLVDSSFKVYSCIDDASDTIIAQYAKDNNCLAILSDDSDFIIFDAAPVMSVHFLNFADMTTVVYEQNCICQDINLKKSELAIIASLIGNEIILYSQLASLHKYIFQRYNKEKKYNDSIVPVGYICHFVRDNRRCGRADLDVIAAEVRRHTSEASANLFKKSVKTYKVGNKDLSIFKKNSSVSTYYKSEMNLLNYIKQQTAMSNISGIILEIILTNKITIGRTFTDPSDGSLAECVEIFRPIRKKLYSLIYNSPEVNKENAVTEIWVTKSKEHRMDDVIPDDVIVNDKVACMTDLWKRAASPSEENRIYQIKSLLICFGFTLESYSTFVLLPLKLQPLCIVLAYMFKHPQISLTKFELEAFVMQALVPTNEEDWKKCKFRKWESRGCHVAALFMSGVRCYYEIASACGMLDFNIGPWMYFDGKKFQFWYQKMKCGLGVELKDIEKELKINVMSFITAEAS